MKYSKWNTIGTVLKMNAINFPEKTGWMDRNRSFTFREWNERACRFANAMSSIGSGHSSRIAVISYNRGEWMDIYAGAAKGGQIVVPILFRHKAETVEYIIRHSEATTVIVEEPFVDMVNSMRDRLPVNSKNYICIGADRTHDGYADFEKLLADAEPCEPDVNVESSAVWTFMYTSGTTGTPKGVVRTHESYMAEYYNDIINMTVLPTDRCLLVMPMCHVNSIFYGFPYTLVTAPVFVYNMKSFDPADLLETIQDNRITFTSLVPTHYRIMLDLPDEVKNSYDVSSIRQLLISSAPASCRLKKEIIDYFKGADLWEAYGTTEGGLITLLRPEDQFRKAGSIGREIFGIDRIRILDENGEEVPDGDTGEIWYRTPMMFRCYWKDAERTERAFRGDYSSAGDMGYRDADGFYYLVDRKANMIITGGENVYPHEIEKVIAELDSVCDVAVIGIPDDKWGEKIMAVTVLNEGFNEEDAKREILEACGRRLAGFMKPKIINFIKEDEMPRNATGKILHRELRDKYGRWSDCK